MAKRNATKAEPRTSPNEAQTNETVETAQSRRLKKFRINPEVFLYMSQGKFEVTANKLPADVKIRGAYYDGNSHTFVTVIESSCFLAVKETEPIPDAESPVITRING